MIPGSDLIFSSSLTVSSPFDLASFGFRKKYSPLAFLRDLLFTLLKKLST